MLISIYIPPDQNLDYFLSIISDTLDFYSNLYDRFIIMGDFIALPTSILISQFTADHCLVNLIIIIISLFYMGKKCTEVRHNANYINPYRKY